MTINHVIVEGIDRLGKDTLIEGIQNRLGFFQVIHYQKPKLLDHFVEAAQYKLWEQGTPFLERNDPVVKAEALKQYQYNSFIEMFKLMQNNTRIICNRAHLGETVYAKRYRGYSGNYVFDLERIFSYQNNENGLSKVLLVLLHTSDFSFITDDGLSLDVTKREEEQNDFKAAYSQSSIPNKIMIDVSNYSGGFISKDFILGAVLNRMK